jgi:hypothetical protein
MAHLMIRQNEKIFAARINALTPQSQRQFGVLDPLKMMRHLRCIVEISLEKVVEADRSNFFKSTIICFLVFRVIPWPKGKIRAPDAFCPEPEGDFETERKKLLEAINEFIAAAEREPQRKTLHPIFGRQTLRYWSRMHGKHFEHHFRQFGV